MLTHQYILNELIFHIDKVTALMHKYPNAIQILNKEDGCHLEVNLSLIEILPEEERQNQE
jgi:hypothetical protein